MRHLSAFSLLLTLTAATAPALIAQAPSPAPVPTTRTHSDAATTKPDLTKTPTLYAVGYAHLDTEWNWDYTSTINQYLPKTLNTNFALFEKYPAYIFNFSGANRYHMMKEYYPAGYQKMAAYIKAGRWFPAGSSMEEGDVNGPSAEAILRQILYGNKYFEKEFGVSSAEYMLPDCFGFPASLPSILAHAGIKGFSTQKLVWGSSVPDQPTTPYKMEGKGVPFNFGTWVGPDGKSVTLAANPGSYSAKVGADLSLPTAVDSSTGVPRANDPVQKQPQTWMSRLEENKTKLGLITDYHYYGTGDTGGSPSDSSVMWIQRAVTNPAASIKVVSARADQFFNDLTPAEIKLLPKYTGEMELQNHSAGSLTSEAYVKRWIRRNEQLADAAEKASIAAEWLGGRKYPLDRLNEAWRLVMGSHFHDIAAGTANSNGQVKAYEYAWNDQLLSLNQFADVLTSATDAVSSALDTRATGTPVVVYNPLNVAREDLVTATINFGPTAPAAVHVLGPDAREVVSQIGATRDGLTSVTFVARAPSVGYAVYDVRAATKPVATASPLKVTDRSLENARYRVTLDDNGDVTSIFDKKVGKELLSAPIQMSLRTEVPSQWPAWNMDYADAIRPARVILSHPSRIEITDHGPARIAITTTRAADSSTFVQTVSLSAGGAGDRVEFTNAVDWRTQASTLKATFPFTASNPEATYNWDVGTIKRGNMYDRKFEVPSHAWVDLTDKGGAYGATVLTDAKNGSNKVDDRTLRLTLIYSPGLTAPLAAYNYQYSQDWGHHDFTFGVAGHTGDYNTGQTDWQAWRLSQPLIAFEAPKHAGSLGKTFSLVRTDNNRIRMMAFKKAELSDEYIVRLNEIGGKQQSNVHVAFGAPVIAAREVDGQERPLGKASVVDGQLVTSFTPFTVRSFAVKLATPASHVAAPAFTAVSLDYDAAVASRDSSASSGGMDSLARAYPAEMLPHELPYDGIIFRLASTSESTPNAVSAHGQSIALPQGKFTKVYLLAAADGDQKGTFNVGGTSTDLDIQDWTGFIGQWDDRTWKQVEFAPTAADSARYFQQLAQDSARMRTDSTYRPQRRQSLNIRRRPMVSGITPAFVKLAPVAWFASHRHTAAGLNDAYQYSYLYGYTLAIPAGATSITLPNNPKIKILAMTVAGPGNSVTPVQPLFDHLERSR